MNQKIPPFPAHPCSDNNNTIQLHEHFAKKFSVSIVTQTNITPTFLIFFKKFLLALFEIHHLISLSLIFLKTKKKFDNPHAIQNYINGK